ncbi:MAG: hypothetical protein WC458_02080 [Patescibacteria group bacterium]
MLEIFKPKKEIAKKILGQDLNEDKKNKPGEPAKTVLREEPKATAAKWSELEQEDDEDVETVGSFQSKEKVG